ncbi:NACHT, LRR and PYD domains-containing protein 1b allele 3-like [Aquarana catesbeiana]|uniref:NACHT, LRR and PYD domains-containing protein 1b allele 3-like n=1 Tax=Aquarana catesbeiana TaxID=8400 RepID=UPI003CC9C8B5
MAHNNSLRVLDDSPIYQMIDAERDKPVGRRQHFVHKHEEALINETDNVDTILHKLLEEELLSDGQYRNICSEQTSQNKMRQLYQYVLSWETEDKDIFLEILKKHNRMLIADMQRRDSMPAEESAPSEEYYLLPSSSSSFSSSHKDERDCDVCGMNHDPADIPVMPNISGNTYRLELGCAGRFCCLETGIKFQVTRPITIEYELDSWSKYMDTLQLQKSGVLGPLFNIKTLIEPNIVSAVYLPHYLCLKELSGDLSWIKCAHYKDGKLSVETPTEVLPFHVILENPSFSSLGVFFWNLIPKAAAKYIPIHGKVHLYFKKAGMKCVEYKIHLYLLPAFAPVNKDFLQEKTSNGFVKIDKPPRTKTIYTKKSYIVKGPGNAHIQPTGLDVQCVSPLESYTDITMDAAVNVIDLSLVQEGREEEIWGCRMSRGEVEELHARVPNYTTPKDLNASSSIPKKHFVDELREALINGVTLVAPILDSLMSAGLLTYEECETIMNERTSFDQMRRLYHYARVWNDTQNNVFYEALKKHNRVLVDNLENPQP